MWHPHSELDELEYVKLGVRMLIDGGMVSLASPFDDPAETILSVRLLGREVAVIRAPLKVFELDELLAALRAGAEKYEWGEKLRRLRSGG